MELIKREIKPKATKTSAYLFSGNLTIEQAKELAELVGGKFHYDSHPGQENKKYYWSITTGAAWAFGGARVGDWLVQGPDGSYGQVAPERFERDWEVVEPEPKEPRIYKHYCKWCGEPIEARSNFGEDYWKHIYGTGGVCYIEKRNKWKTIKPVEDKN